MREESKGHDADTLFEYFSSEKEKNPSFHFVFDKDDQDRMTRYWTDAKSRRAYTFFGDVVIFYTTYNTNKYSMIFAPLMGVNHHNQTVIFGCAFLSDETTESFVWLFNQWLDSMLEGPPKIIVTDQDPTMAKAILERLPNTFHRYCIWHIMDKFSVKLGPLNYRDYYHYFKNSVYGSDSKEDFEESWANALEISCLQDHGWLRSLYNIRSSWVPAYINHIFSAGISSSQRAESGHSFFKKYVKNNNSLIDFITRFNRALGRQRELERISDWIDINEKTKLKSAFPMEQQMAEVYTTKVFKIFQQQVFESNAYMVHRVSENETSCYYMVKRVNPEVDDSNKLLMARHAQLSISLLSYLMMHVSRKRELHFI